MNHPAVKTPLLDNIAKYARRRNVHELATVLLVAPETTRRLVGEMDPRTAARMLEDYADFLLDGKPGWPIPVVLDHYPDAGYDGPGLGVAVNPPRILLFARDRGRVVLAGYHGRGATADPRIGQAHGTADLARLLEEDARPRNPRSDEELDRLSLGAARLALEGLQPALVPLRSYWDDGFERMVRNRVLLEVGLEPEMEIPERLPTKQTPEMEALAEHAALRTQAVLLTNTAVVSGNAQVYAIEDIAPLLPDKRGLEGPFALAVVEDPRFRLGGLNALLLVYEPDPDDPGRVIPLEPLTFPLREVSRKLRAVRARPIQARDPYAIRRALG